MFPSYHYCITFKDGEARVVETHDLRANMCDLRTGTPASYAAHTAGRNSFAAGIAVAGMHEATPYNFGRYPLREEAIQALCFVAGAIASRYCIPVDAEHVMTHAEAALIDGYFGERSEERWDIARLAARTEPLVPQDARDTGEILRAWIRDTASRIRLA